MNLLLKSFGIALLFWAGVAGAITAAIVGAAGVLWLVNTCPRALAYVIVAVVVLASSTVVIYSHKKLSL